MENYKSEAPFEKVVSCECGNEIYEMEVNWDKDVPNKLLVSFTYYPISLWQLLKWWGQRKKIYTDEVVLNRNETTDLRNTLNKFLEETENG